MLFILLIISCNSTLQRHTITNKSIIELNQKLSNFISSSKSSEKDYFTIIDYYFPKDKLIIINNDCPIIFNGCHDGAMFFSFACSSKLSFFTLCDDMDKTISSNNISESSFNYHPNYLLLTPKHICDKLTKYKANQKYLGSFIRFSKNCNICITINELLPLQ